MATLKQSGISIDKVTAKTGRDGVKLLANNAATSSSAETNGTRSIRLRGVVEPQI
jgi:hypothetical protein